MLAVENEEEPTVRVATYTRISTDEAHQPYSLDAQDQRLAAYIASQAGWEHVARFSDQLSGASTERSGLRAALGAAAAGSFEVLVVYRIDRLARSVRGLAQIIEDLDAAGVAFRSATEPFDTQSAAGRMMVQMLGVFAEFERATIIDRVIAGMERKAASGGWCGGREPIGYRAVKGEGRLAIQESEAAVVARIFDRYVSGRLGSHAIAAELNAAGYRSRAGRPWSYKSVLTVLRNRSYLGEVRFRDSWHPEAHPPLVDPQTFAAAQALLAERSEEPAKRAANASDYLLAGLVVCARCGRRFSGTRARGRSSTYRYYTCGGRQRYGKDGCDADRLPAEALDAAVIDQLLDVYADGALFAKAAEREAQRLGSRRRRLEDERAAAEAELAKAEAAIDRYLDAFEVGTLSPETCGARVKALGERVDSIRHHLDALLDQPEETPASPSAEDLLALRVRVQAAIADGSPAIVKQLLGALIHEVRVESRHAIRPVYRVPSGDHVQHAVRAPSRSVGRRGLEPLTPCASWANLALGPVSRWKDHPWPRHRRGLVEVSAGQR
ncbi:MAG TPA: recombinase family protein [Acidimicrobiales bacterium]|nr:recombinase family protein [Acidimicrobiales bacterium]